MPGANRFAGVRVGSVGSARSVAFIVAVALLSFPPSLWAKEHRDDRVVCRDGFLQVVSPDHVDVDDCKSAAGMAIAAWKFDESEMQWGSWSHMQTPLTLRLISDARMDKEWPGGTRAWAESNGNRFNMRASLVGDPSGPRTLAHELGHIQSYRVLRRARARKEIPDYFFEGHGLILNRLYARHLHVDDPKGWASQLKLIKKLPADEVRMIFTDPSYLHGEKDPKKNNKIHAMGLYFVEYLHGRHHVKDIATRMGRVFEEVGRGHSYAAAFHDVIGVSLDSVISEIVDLFDRTASAPEERFVDTRFEEWAGKSSAP